MGAISLVIIGYVLFLSTALSDLIIEQKLYYAAFLIWRVYPFVIPIILSIISFKAAAKLHFGIYKKNSTLILFILVFISTTIWAWTHDTRINFWDDKVALNIGADGFTENSIKIVHEYKTDTDIEGEEQLSVSWPNNYGFTQKIYLKDGGFSSEYQPHILTYTDIKKKRTSNVFGDIGEFYSEIIIAFFYDPLYKLVYEDIELKVLLYIVIGFALSMGVLLLGIFEVHRETNISIIFVHTFMSMVLFLFLSDIWMLSSIVGLLVLIISIIKIISYRQATRH